MTAFEIVFGLLTMIASLAIAHLLNWLAIILRNVARVRFSVAHALWAWTAFALVIGNWASYWEMRSVASWPAWAVLLIIAAFTVQYVFCALVTPEMPEEGVLDLEEFHARSRSFYIIALIVLIIVSIVLNSTFGEAGFYKNWWRDNVFSVVDLLLCVVAITFGARWVQTGSALVLAALSTYFMVVTCNVVSA